MNIKNKLTKIGSTFLLLTALTACGMTETSGDDAKKNGNGSGPITEDKGTEGIVAGQLMTELEEMIQDGKIKYIFTIKNNKEKEQVLKFSSTQQFEYTLKDDSGTHVYTYSMDKMFAQTTSEKTLKPGEIFEMEIDLTEDLKKLKPGTYQFEVWSTAKDLDDLKAKAEFNWGGEGEGLEETGKLKGFTVTYVGLMDNNSIEVINEDGQYDHFRLSEKVKADIQLLEKDDKITIFYMEVDGQKVIEQVTKE